MRIHRVSLRDFRGVVTADIHLAPEGITIVQGPNEVGKTSVADAIEMLITDPDSSTRGRVKAAQPAGKDVGPWVEMEFETGDYRLTYSKRWVRNAGTELTIVAPVHEQLTGRSAHDRVGEILDETLDSALFAALRHQQGVPLGQADLAGSASLARALDRAAQGGPIGAVDAAESDLIGAIDAERQMWSTKGGRPNRARQELRDAADVARDTLATESAALNGLEDRIEEHQRIEHDLIVGDAGEPEMRDRVATIEAENVAIADRERTVHDLDQAAQLADSVAREATTASDTRTRLVDTLAEADARIADIGADEQRAGGRMDGATTTRDAAAARLALAAESRVRADAAFDAAAADAEHLRDVFDLGFLRERDVQVRTADEIITACDAFLLDCPLSALLMEQIDDAAELDAMARGRLGIASTRVRVTAESPQHIHANGDDHHLGLDEVVDVDLAPGAVLLLPGIVRLGVMGDDTAVTDAARAACHLGDLLTLAGIAEGGVLAARSLDRRRREEEARGESARDDRTQQLRDLTSDEMDGKIARAEERVVEYTESRAADVVVPASVEEANSARARAEEDRGAARREEDSARDAHSVSQQAVTALQTAAAVRGSLLGVVQEKADTDRVALEEARTGSPDAALDAAATRLRAEAVEAHDRHAAEAEALRKEDPDVVRERLDNARGAVERLMRERGDLRLRRERLAGEISSVGDDGLADRVARATDQLEAAEASRDDAERRGDAADLLYEVMMRHRDAAQRSYVAPFRAEIERLAAFVFGPGTTVDVDHTTLAVQRRTRGGVTVEYDNLSGGAREQLAVIGRLAAATMTAPDDGSAGGGTPVIIDDALGYSDAVRLEGIGAALAAAGRRCQVIVLTCMPERYSGIGSATVVRMEVTR